MKKMKKRIYGLVVTISLAATLVLANSIFVANAFPVDVPNINTDSTIMADPDFDTSANVEDASSYKNVQSYISNIEHFLTMIPVNYMQEDEAIQVSKKAIFDNYGSLVDDMFVFSGVCEITDQDGIYWFVSFMSEELVSYDEQMLNNDNETLFDNYGVLINAETGEIVDIEKNVFNSSELRIEKSE